MANRHRRLERHLCQEVDSLLRGKRPYSGAVLRLRRSLREHGCRAFLFGGILRHLVSGKAHRMPRDIDIVIDVPPNGAIEGALAGFVSQRNRFGGVRLSIDGVGFDLWSLPSTWAFAEGLATPQSFDALPRTTFFNVQAIAVELGPDPAHSREVHNAGFFEALSTRLLETNLEDNPYPKSCVVRALAMAQSEDMRLGPKLQDYIARHGPAVSNAELVSLQRDHFGRIVESPSSMRDSIEEFARARCAAKGVAEFSSGSRPQSSITAADLTENACSAVRDYRGEVEGELGAWAAAQLPGFRSVQAES